MKASIFNYYATINDKKYLFNTNNCGLLELPEGDFTGEEKEYLAENGFYVNDDEDEIQKLENEINGNIKHKDGTLELTIALTNQCNFRCKYCYQDKSHKVMTEQTADDIIQKIKEILSARKYEEIWIHYFGGEPLLNIPILKKLDKAIRFTAQNYNIGYHSYLTTNGSMLSDELLSTMKFDNIQLTFDGKERTHNSLRISDNFHFKDEIILLQNIIENTDAKVILRMNACVQNRNEILGFYHFLLENVDNERIDINLNRMIKYHKDDDFEMLTEQEYAELFYELQKLVVKMTGKIQLPTALKTPCKFTCGIAYSISPDGCCNLCSGSPEDGNILFKDIDITNYNPIKFREECRSCVCLPLCLGGCEVQHELGAGCCTYEKFCLDRILKLYIDKTEEL